MQYVSFSHPMEEQSGIDRERRMMESGRYEKLDLSFLENWFSHDPAALESIGEDCGMRIAECGLRSADCGLRIAERGGGAWSLLTACGPVSTALALRVSLAIELPDEFVRAVRIPEAELAAEARKALTVAFYARGLLSLGKAVELSGLRRSEFETILAERRIQRPWSAAEVDADLKWAGAGR